MAVRWIFNLVNSKDLSPIGELAQASSKQISLTLNRAGSASFNLPMTDDMAEFIHPITTGLRVYRIGTDDVAKTIWSGYVSTIDESISGNQMGIQCVGWFERLSKRLIREKMNYAAVDDAEIIFALLKHANLRVTPAPDNYPIVTPAGSNPSTPTWIAQGAKLPNEGLGGSTAYVPATRNRNYELYASIGQEIQSWSEIENGCDFVVDPSTRELNIYRKKMTNRPAAVFGFNWGPNNLAQFSRQIDSSALTNFHTSTGKPFTIPQFADDLASQNDYGVFEEVAQLSDVGENSVLSAYSGAEIIFRSRPRIIYAMTPFPFIEGGRVPEPFLEYDIGDKAYLTAKWGKRVNIAGQAVRVFGMSVSIDEEGNEKLGQLQLAPGG